MSRHPVLMTGASGFIGQRLQSVLLENGHGVCAIIRPFSPNISHISPGCEVVTAELSEQEKLGAACSNAEAVIYCAGTVRGRDPGDFKAANVDGIAHMVDNLNHSGSQAPFLLISSLAASRPEISDYANSKYLGEKALTTNAAFPWTIFRPPAVYGPGDREMLPILKMARRGLVTRPGPSGQRLSLLHVDDLSRAVLAWLDSWQECQGQTFTLDDGRAEGYDWRSIAESATKGRYFSLGIPRSLLAAVANINLGLSTVFSYAPMLTPGKVRELTQTDWLCDNSALNQATGWEPSIDLESGIRKLFSGP
ncbi:MAG: NAD-dependent epimerase/dehydratase family protein [Gammaproteobacteria bacterium]|nr:NAD-dependent epimerase/dehydratase family protein [Gammaproteobacteria bacterium]